MSSSWTARLPDSPGVVSFARFIVRDVIFLPGLFCLVLGLAGCGQSPSYDSQGATPPPPATAPPGSAQRPLLPGQLGRPLGPDGLPTLDAPKGVNVSVDTLFSDDIKDPIARIRRLENAVLELRRDYDATLPSIRHLVSVEKDMQALMAQLEILTNTAPSALPVPIVPLANAGKVPPERDVPAPVAQEKQVPVAQAQHLKPAPETRAMPAAPVVPAALPTHAPLPLVPAVPKARAPQVPSGVHAPLAASAPSPVAVPEKAASLAALAFRLGEDGGKTRMVVDLNGAVKHRADLDNEENLLVVELPGAGWDAPAKRAFSSSLIKAYSTEPLGSRKGTRLILVLRKTVKMVLNTMLDPGSGNAHYRLVIDLKKE